MKSIIITPPIFLNFNCLAISTAASQLVHRTVSRELAERVKEPELTSITVKASVGSIIMFEVLAYRQFQRAFFFLGYFF